MNENILLDRTYIVIINWKLPADTIECVESLLKAGARASQIIVVDNGSNDNSVERIRSACGQQIQLLESSENLGFSGGNNLAIEHALQQEAEWILLANNDTVVAPTFFAELADVAEKYPACSLIAPLILYYKDAKERLNPIETIWSLGDRLIPGTLITRSLFRNQTMPDELPDFIAVDFLNACGLLINRKVFEKIGTFDLSYFMYAEDVDFCWRAQRAGFKLGCATRANMWHKVSRSTGIHHPDYRYWTIANQIRFYRQYATVWQWPIMFCFTLLHNGRTMLLDLLAGRIHLFQIVIRAWFDGWFRNNATDLAT